MMPDEPTIFLRDHLMHLIETNDRRYKAEIRSLKELLMAELRAQKEAVSTALASSDKAVAKAEEAQQRVNIGQNEFRGAVSDLTADKMPRSEVLTMFKALEEKVAIVQSDVQLVNEALSRNVGVSLTTHEGKQQDNWRIGAIIAAAGLIFAIVSMLLRT